MERKQIKFEFLNCEAAPVSAYFEESKYGFRVDDDLKISENGSKVCITEEIDIKDEIIEKDEAPVSAYFQKSKYAFRVYDKLKIPENVSKVCITKEINVKEQNIEKDKALVSTFFDESNYKKSVKDTDAFRGYDKLKIPENGSKVWITEEIDIKEENIETDEDSSDSELIINEERYASEKEEDIVNDEVVDGCKLQKYEKPNTGEKNCFICQKTFSHLGALKRHEFIHFKGKEHRCSICKMSYIYLWDLKKHEATHLKMKERETNNKIGALFKCKICQITFNTQRLLETHKKNYCRKRRYRCKKCSKAYTHARYVRPHELICVGKPYKCSQCSKDFSRRRTWRLHQLACSKDPYKCKDCCQTFTQSRYLEAHLRKCSRRRYTCEKCNEDFPEDCHLQLHQLTCSQKTLQVHQV